MRMEGKIVVGVLKGDKCLKGSQFVSRKPH